MAPKQRLIHHLSVSPVPNLGKTTRSPQSDLTPWILTLVKSKRNYLVQFLQSINNPLFQNSFTSIITKNISNVVQFDFENLLSWFGFRASWVSKFGPWVIGIGVGTPKAFSSTNIEFRDFSWKFQAFVTFNSANFETASWTPVFTFLNSTDWRIQRWAETKMKKNEKNYEMVFCYQNCSDLLWENSRPSAFQKFFSITRKIYSNSERSEQFLLTECFFNLFLEVSHTYLKNKTIFIKIGKNHWDWKTCRKS